MKLELFFDYICPYCVEGFGDLRNLLPNYPQIEIVWRPCEVHARPDNYGMHSDLCIQSMYFAADQGVDLWTYHQRMYEAAAIRRINIEDMDTLADFVADLVDGDGLRQALRRGTYREVQQEANRYAFADCGVEVVPSYRLNGHALNAVENVGVPIAQLAAFLDAFAG